MAKEEVVPILGIETSCDETAVAIVKNGREIVESLVSSQIKLHQPFGGVVPEIASRAHLDNLPLLMDKLLESTQINLEDIVAIGVTQTPGLVGALLVGISYAKGLAVALNKPLIGINHLYGHIYAAKMEHPSLEYPYLCLVVSGGHTGLYLAHSPLEYQLIGQTIDDAAGEAFDKVASLLNLGYPGGPIIDKISKEGNPRAYEFPRSFLNEKDRFDFSFSGLKTAVLYKTRGQDKRRQAPLLEDIVIPDVAASFQSAVVDVLVGKTMEGAKKWNIPRIALGGGVACNSYLREEMVQAGKKEGIEVFLPSLPYCTDNAAMIAGLAYHYWKAGQTSQLDLE
ncbi:MAG: tRNA (adenosine(37)-N6)-threonylcarbamoyltransferase complex transferase subunit TsaD [Planctomycetota bacterium]|nr:MAG: tRNA (adenosine(37)-N6)-threonylcarbamoyltransferase complex transferase subunit TsaD [Planctomycetota bacterium]